MRAIHGLTFVSIMIAAAGCWQFGDQYRPVTTPAEKAVITIYRPYHVASASETPMLTCGHESIEMDPGRFQTFIDKPGPVVCSAPGSPDQLKFETRAAEQYFVKVEVGAREHARFTLLSAKDAEPEVAKCTKQE